MNNTIEKEGTMSNIFDFTSISEHVAFREAGYNVFGLYSITDSGKCACEYPDCKNVGKHPIRSGWQHPIDWDDEQWYIGHIAGQFKTGYGVLMRGLLVVDVDAKNGGVASFKKLMEDVPELAECGLAINTGSGGGSQHWYFKYSGGALRQCVPEYPGIDFKSTGFVVGPGSLHKSGAKYTIAHGSVSEIGEAPDTLLELLAKPATFRVDDDDRAVDVTEQELVDMLDHIEAEDYDTWIRVGMALHQTLDGDGYDLFDHWSQKSDKYEQESTHYKWRTFRKDTSGGVGFATLKWYAIQGGWVEPVTFDPKTIDTEVRSTGVNLKRPPGFVGDLCDWINDQCPKPRENLAVAAALTAVGNIAGIRYKDNLPRGATPNLFTLCVAGSGSGKNSIVQAVNKIQDIAGLLSVTYGKSKSSQEIYRNLIEKPLSMFNIDELGIKFSSIANAGKSGASYYETWFGEMMSLYSNANGIVNLSGDEVREIQRALAGKVADVQKAMDENELDRTKGEALLEKLRAKMERPALINPFVSLIGYSTPETLDPIVTPERVREGFLGRTLLAVEPVDLPEDKPNFRPREMSAHMQLSLQSIANAGYSDLLPWEEPDYRVGVSTTTDAMTELLELPAKFHAMAESYLEENGMHAVPVRGMELVTKISFILAIPGRQRTLEHVQWAFAYVVNDIEQKIRMAVGNSGRDDALYNRILALVSPNDPISEGRLVDRTRGRNKWKKEQVAEMLEKMVKSEILVRSVIEHPRTGRETVRYILNH